MENWSAYKHTCPNGKVYIGITSYDINIRWRNAGKGYKGMFFYKAIQKYGWDNIQHEILFTNLAEEQAYEKEIELIAKYKSNQREFGYNLAIGGKTNKGCKRLDAAKPVICLETGEVFYAACEASRKLGLAANSIIGACNRTPKILTIHGLHFSWYVGQTIEDCKVEIESIEANRKSMSEIQKREKGYWYGKPSPRRKRVLCVETGKIYCSVSIATKETSINNISACCTGRIKTAGGYRWKYIDEY